MQASEFLSLVVEITVAIAGFSGIVVVLGRRESGRWTPIDRVRFRHLLISSFLPLGVSGLALILLVSEVREDAIWAICSAVYAPTFSVLTVIGMRSAVNEAGDNRLTLALFGLAGTAVILLQAANAISIHEFWPFAIGTAFQIFIALYSFGSLILEVLSNEDAV